MLMWLSFCLRPIFLYVSCFFFMTVQKKGKNQMIIQNTKKVLTRRKKDNRLHKDAKRHNTKMSETVLEEHVCQKEESKFTRSWTQRILVWCYFQIWMKTECQHFTKSAVGASQNMMLLWSNNVCHGQHKAAAIMHLALSPHIWSYQNGGICQD